MTAGTDKGRRLSLNTESIRLQRSARKGTRFCLMILGENGTGKSTFLNNLCNRNHFPNEKQKNISECFATNKMMNVNIYEPVFDTITLSEYSNTSIILDIVLFPCSGNMIDNSKTPQIISNYLDNQFELILNEEKKINRTKGLIDTRPHVCLYFLRGISRGLKEFDVKVMKEIGHKVNLIPIISKADTLTVEELNFNKHLIMQDIKNFGINIFDFQNDTIDGTLCEFGETEDLMNKDRDYGYSLINDLVPFALTCGDKVEEDEDGNLMHKREYLWGGVIAEDRTQSEFLLLKGILLGSHLQELKENTANILYERYRTEKLLQEAGKENDKPESHSTNINTGLSYSSNQSQQISLLKLIKDNDDPVGNENDEKDNMIKAYQKKIEELQNELNNMAIKVSDNIEQ